MERAVLHEIQCLVESPACVGDQFRQLAADCHDDAEDGAAENGEQAQEREAGGRRGREPARLEPRDQWVMAAVRIRASRMGVTTRLTVRSP
jgi:ribosomal protein L19E